MIRKFVAVVAFFALTLFSHAQTMGRLPGVVFPSDRGARTSATLSTVLTGVSTVPYTFVLDKGAWVISTNISIPATIDLKLLPGAYFSIATNCNLEILGGFDAGAEAKFTGNGTASGPASFPYRHAIWGDTNQYNIGDGYIVLDLGWETTLTNSSWTYVDNTTQSFWDVIIRDDLDVADDVTIGGDLSVTGATTLGNTTITGDLSVAGTATFGDMTFNGDWINASNDMAVSFMGYPKLTLTTNMVTAYSSGGTAVTVDSFTNAFDGSLVSVTSTGATGSGVGQGYLIDLGQPYNGMASVYITVRNLGGPQNFYIGMKSEVVSRVGAFAQADPSTETDYGIVATSTNVFNLIKPVSGRYLQIILTTDSSGSSTYNIHDLAVYGTTNVYRNMGGWQ